ncbi:hypothetical protein D7V80_04030 [Corallococcus sp. CA054B]|uniref:immunity 52 family protein n=1 Tax=Corallococcus sp. CA054B TaxID=2316734 RepID=UPI000EA14494|nr:immunity 52 family protein [Corallococcus sp. CA054B]RKG70739.1 hypothetical protein D7V80_04030 [Corallococcus sp. CA054B]
MTDDYYVGAYWLGRSEDAESCATRASNLFDALGRLEPEWRRWHEAGRTFKDASARTFSTDRANFMKLFARKKNRLGDAFRYWLWAGTHPDETSLVDGYCGSADDVPTSMCLVSPPRRGDMAERVLSAPLLREVLRSVVRCWEPTWSVVASREYRDKVSPSSGDAGTFVGWMTYFSRQWGEVPPLPAPVRVEPVDDLGTLVLLTEERFTVTNPEHVRLATEVHQVLDAAGLLRAL